MPWCPKCGAEYRDGFTRCASCDVPLVDRLTDEQSEEANESETERECDKMVLPRGHEQSDRGLHREKPSGGRVH